MTKKRLIDPEPGVIMAPHYEEEVRRLVKDPVIVEMVDQLPTDQVDKPSRWDFTMTANRVYAQRCANRQQKPINESIGGVRWAILALLRRREENDYGQH